ncbi:ATP-binding cassette domain-containing protein [Streptomyces sp. SID8361]|uniref:ABC transporter ATP-binding protein n=1 Tax=Streptomyces sp. MnatMP-M27 TaxID=1839768 RepID=UPI00081D769B|nr:ABC transporter ATP-binding protein [Streptomyces sp. MnatMP-M27]MYU12635.1 ATP-binding cassette domain-containing protein [Streptomyces sp. SID8361]SCF93577.1 putative ABC transport system ATP-binding protein [Streptomyces sp. MnatMP-M27]
MSEPVSRASLLQSLGHVVHVSPELLRGVGLTLAIGVVATAGRIAVPFALRETVDNGLRAAGGPDPGHVELMTAVGALGILLTGVAGYLMNTRMVKTAETGLARMRTTVFRRIHQLPLASEDAERRGSLVARVTTDIDTMSTFLQGGGLVLVLSLGQLTVATALMLVYSWQLTLLVWLCFLPLFLWLPSLQRRVAHAYAAVRARMADMMSALSEAIAGADAIEVFGAQAHIRRRVDEAVSHHEREAARALGTGATGFSCGVLLSGLVVALVVGVGGWLGTLHDLTLGKLLAFVFLVQLFTVPLQYGTEMLNDLQNAASGWRRVAMILAVPPELPQPPRSRHELPPGPIAVRLDGIMHAYPGGEPVLHDVSLELPAGSKTAVVGETGSGKSTIGKLLTRLTDPTAGRVLLSGMDARDQPLATLRERVTLVPQDGFLFAGTLRENLTWGRPRITADQVGEALRELGLDAWSASLPAGLETKVGPRGQNLSAGERQLVGLVRAHLVGSDLLVLDEATSAVDPALETRLRKALEVASRSRTLVTIAHRLATAETADLVVVVHQGRVVSQGTHSELATRCADYQRLLAGWTRRAAAVASYTEGDLP